MYRLSGLNFRAYQYDGDLGFYVMLYDCDNPEREVGDGDAKDCAIGMLKAMIEILEKQ
jgi:hypothetical protein